uniref:Secreted protein n=1 Tax=Syphacia muris TaxID=451379 RepID=A0A0N5B1P2_9BILA
RLSFSLSLSSCCQHLSAAPLIGFASSKKVQRFARYGNASACSAKLHVSSTTKLSASRSGVPCSCRCNSTLAA